MKKSTVLLLMIPFFIYLLILGKEASAQIKPNTNDNYCIKLKKAELCGATIALVWGWAEDIDYDAEEYHVVYQMACRNKDGSISANNDWQYIQSNDTIEFLPVNWANPSYNPYINQNHIDFEMCNGVLLPSSVCFEPVIIAYVYALSKSYNYCNSLLHVFDFVCNNCIPNGSTGIRATSVDLQGIEITCDPRNIDCIEQLTNNIDSGNKTIQSVNPSNDITLSTAPNPFSNQTVFNYTLPEQATVSIHVFDIQGRIVANLLHEETQEAANYQQTWSADRMPKGVYYYQLTVDGVPYTKKVVKF